MHLLAKSPTVQDRLSQAGRETAEAEVSYRLADSVLKQTIIGGRQSCGIQGPLSTRHAVPSWMGMCTQGRPLAPRTKLCKRYRCSSTQQKLTLCYLVVKLASLGST